MTETARQIDLLPTILEAVGEPIPAGLQGLSLLPLVTRSGAWRGPTATYAHLELDGQHLESVTTEDRKLIHYLEDHYGHPERELYDLDRDRLERHSLAQQQPLWTGYLTSLLEYRRSFWPPPAEAVEVEIDEELRRSLEALGYLQ